MSDGNTDDDMLHISNVLLGVGGAACSLIHRRQRRAGMNSSVMRRGENKEAQRAEEIRKEAENKEHKRGLQGGER